MWNGVWKLAVMVGVVGIGLFAVFQAQKGMNRFASVASIDDTGEETADAADNATDNVSDRDSLSSLSEPLLLSVNHREASRTAKETPRPGAADRIDLVSNANSEPSRVKTAVGTSSSATPTLTLATRDTRRVGLSFQDDDAEEPFDEAEGSPAAAPQALPLEALEEEQPEPSPKLVTPDSATPDSDNLDSSAGPEVTEGPFAKDLALPARETSPDEATPEPLKTKTDFGEESEIPRSRRGMQKTESRSEPAEQAADSFENEAETKPMAAPPAADPDFDFSDTPAAPVTTPETTPAETAETETTEAQTELPADPVDEPASKDEPAADEPVEEEAQPEPLPEPTPAPTVKARSYPAELPNPSDDDTVPARSQAAKNRPKVPVESNLDAAASRRGHVRESSPKPQTSTDDLVADDMIGDGVAGDETQRGVQQPRLTIEKVAQQQAILNQPLVYTIIVRNTGSVAAHNVVIEDRIPKGTELLGTAPRAELVGKTLVWKEQILRPNEQKRISIQVVPKQEGPIGSVARVHFATEVSTEIQVAAPQLEFTVNAPAEVRLGQSIDLVFQLKNTGKVEASNIIVRDIVPEYLKHETGNDIECPIGKLAPNEVREIILPVVAVKLGTGENRAVLTADGGIQKELDSTIHVVGEQLVLTRTGHNRVYVEKPAAFTNNIRNDGNLKVPQVRVAEIVPAGMEFESASDGGKYDSNRNAVVWTVGPLAPGDDRALTVKYIPKETGTLNGKVTATAASGGKAEVNSTVEVVGRPELQMETLSATGLVTVGDKITSKFQLKNMGTATARNVQLKIQLPPELKLVNVRGTRFQKTKNNTIIFDSIDELAPKSNAAFELVLEPTEEAEARISIEILADHLSKPHRREESIQIARDSLN